MEFVVSVAPPAGGGAIPPEGMSPASTDVERTTIRVIDIKNRFTGFLLEVAHARFLTSEKNRATSGNSCKVRMSQLISPRSSKLSYTHLERAI